ncbi:MAG: dipeptide ABC transporter ATP-binding protein [Pseudomonadota bacterium]
MTEILRVENLMKHFPVRGGFWGREIGRVHAVNDVSFSLKSSETLGIVGESGCGKSTLGRTLLRLYEADSGKVYFKNQNLFDLSKRDLRHMRRDIQMIFQDPNESLNSRQTVESILSEPLEVHGIGDRQSRKEEVKSLLAKVGLPDSAGIRYPHEFSGGQRQRIGIARAIALKPSLIVCDEPVSALDVSIQSQVLNLLLKLQSEMQLSYIFIAHNLAVVRHISDRVAVMYLGEIVELTDADSIYSQPLHPYTKALISAVPTPDPFHTSERIVLKGDVPSPFDPPFGCAFHPRCPHAVDQCKREKPVLRNFNGHQVACHLAETL